jgi:hypothetical protein
MAASARLTAEFWVKAYIARLRLSDIPVFVRARGDATAGAVLIKLNTLDGKAVLYQRGFAMEGDRGWDVLSEGEDATVEKALTRQLGYDSDLWVLELEDAEGRTLLDEPGLRE